MHFVTFTEGQCLSHQTGHSLAQRIVKALDMAGLPIAFVRGDMLLGRKHDFIGFPEIRIQNALPVSNRNALPKNAASRLATVADGKSDDLTTAAAHGQPNPALLFASEHERPEFIDLQRLADNGFDQRLGQRRQVTRFFLTRRSAYCDLFRRCGKPLASKHAPDTRPILWPERLPDRHDQRHRLSRSDDRRDRYNAACHCIHGRWTLS